MYHRISASIERSAALGRCETTQRLQAPESPKQASVGNLGATAASIRKGELERTNVGDFCQATGLNVEDRIFFSKSGLCWPQETGQGTRWLNYPHTLFLCCDELHRARQNHRLVCRGGYLEYVIPFFFPSAVCCPRSEQQRGKDDDL